MFNKFLEKSISASQRCQRNWDLSRNISAEDMETLKTAVTQCSSKQNRVFYKCLFITNRELIEKIHAGTNGFKTPDGEVHTNSQVLANLVVAFVEDRDPAEGIRTDEEQVIYASDEPDPKELAKVQRDQQVAVGIASGYLTLVSNMLGLKTGCCQCFYKNEMKEILDVDSEVFLLMGIGYPDTSRSRLEHQTEESFKFPSFNKEIKVIEI